MLKLKSENKQAISIISPDGKEEVKNAIVKEYTPVDSNTYLEANGKKPLESGEELVKVVDVTFIDNQPTDQINSPGSVQPYGIGDFYTQTFRSGFDKRNVNGSIR